MKTPTYSIGIDGLTIRIDGREIRISTLRKFRGDAPAPIHFIQIEVFSLSFAEVAQVSVILNVMTHLVPTAHAWAGLKINQGRGAVVFPGIPSRQNLASGEGQIVCAVPAVAQNITRYHAADAARGVGGIGIPVWPVKWVTVPEPAKNRGMPSRRVAAFMIGFRGGIHVDVVAEQVTQGDGFGVVMICAKLRLMGISGVKRFALEDISIPVPNMIPLPYTSPGIAIAPGRMRIRKSVPRIEDFHPVNAQTDRSQGGQPRYGRGHPMPGKSKGEMLIHWQVREQILMLEVVVPRPHDLAAQARAANIDPVAGRINALNTAFNWLDLVQPSVTPGDFGSTGTFIGVRPVNPGKLAGIHREPGSDLGIGPEPETHSQKQRGDEPAMDIPFHGLFDRKSAGKIVSNGLAGVRRRTREYHGDGLRHRRCARRDADCARHLGLADVNVASAGDAADGHVTEGAEDLDGENRLRGRARDSKGIGITRQRIVAGGDRTGTAEGDSDDVAEVIRVLNRSLRIDRRPRR